MPMLVSLWRRGGEESEGGGGRGGGREEEGEGSEGGVGWLHVIINCHNKYVCSSRSDGIPTPLGKCDMTYCGEDMCALCELCWLLSSP